MSTGLGIKGILGMAKQAVYETAVDATDKVPFISESIAKENENILHDYLFGSAAVPGSDIVFEPVKGSFEARIPYTVIDAAKTPDQFVSTDLPIALAMGTCTWDAGTSANQLTFADNLEVDATIGVDKGQSSTAVWESIGAMINSMTIAGSSNEYLSATFEIIAKDLKIASSQNTPTEFAALLDDIPNLLKFSDLTFRIGDQADALSSADNKCISAFSLAVNNNLQEAQQATPCAAVLDEVADTYAHSNTKEPLKPRRNGFRECTLEITVPRYESDFYLDARDNETNLQGWFNATDGADNVYLYLPNVKVESVSAPVAGSDLIQQTVTLRLLKYNDHGFMKFTDSSTTDTGELWIELINDRIADILP